MAAAIPAWGSFAGFAPGGEGSLLSVWAVQVGEAGVGGWGGENSPAPRAGPRLGSLSLSSLFVAIVWVAARNVVPDRPREFPFAALCTTRAFRDIPGDHGLFSAGDDRVAGPVTMLWWSGGGRVYPHYCAGQDP